MFLDFFIFELRREGISIGMQDVLTFYRGLSRGLVANLDELYLYARLCFIRYPRDNDLYDRIFLRYFQGIDIPAVAEDDLALLETKQFRQWLKQAIEEHRFEIHPHFMPLEELMKKFWQTVREQMEAHHGGAKWVGTGGKSPFGHSGSSRGGVRVFGGARNFSAMKVAGERRYVNYSEDKSLRHDTMRAALAQLKHLKPEGAESILDIDESIRKSALSGGEIELVFKRELRDKLDVLLFIDNGGSSMLPYVSQTRQLFSKMKRELKSLRVFYFHNTIYSYVFRDPARTQPYSLQKLLKEKDDIRVFIIGDANMAPSELLSAYGNINLGEEETESSLYWLERIRERFRHTVWLNPMRRDMWPSASMTLRRIAEIFPMEEMTLGGIRRAVERLNRS